MWGGADPDTELFASGVMTEDEGDWVTGGQAATGTDAAEAGGELTHLLHMAWALNNIFYTGGHVAGHPSLGRKVTTQVRAFQHSPPLEVH